MTFMSFRRQDAVERIVFYLSCPLKQFYSRSRQELNRSLLVRLSQGCLGGLLQQAALGGWMAFSSSFPSMYFHHLRR